MPSDPPPDLLCQFGVLRQFGVVAKLCYPRFSIGGRAIEHPGSNESN
jgi:hypothetical protein